jgi:DUF4097 and DUF4098 domain-containing protein YvlB
MKTKTSRLDRHSRILLAFTCLLTLGIHTARAMVEGNLKKTFTVSPGGKLVVDADRGSIEVNSTKDSAVQVEVFRKITGTSDVRGQAILDDHKVNMEQEGNTVTVRAKDKKEISNAWNNDRNRLQVRYVISVPDKFNVDLKTFGGNITVDDLNGEVKMQTSGGNLKLGRIQGPITGHTSGGNIKVAGGKGAVKVETSGGNIEIGEVEGNVSAHTSGGSIHIKTVKGDLVARTTGGGITAEAVHGSLAASTSGGSISAALADQPTGDSRLETSGGNISVRLNERAAFDINAQANGGGVNTELPVTSIGEHKRSSLKGKLNGGGKSLVLKTSGGTIHLRKL